MVIIGLFNYKKCLIIFGQFLNFRYLKFSVFNPMSSELEMFKSPNVFVQFLIFNECQTIMLCHIVDLMVKKIFWG